MYSISIYDTKLTRRKELEKLLESYFSANKLQLRIRGYSVLSDLISTSGHTDIVFVSVDDNGDNVIELCSALIKENPDIHLCVVSDTYEYLDDAMDLKVFRYFDRPVDRIRLFAALDDIINKTLSITFISEHIYITLNESEIVCIYKSDRKTCVLTNSGKVYPTTLSLKEWLERTKPGENFVCPHYGYIINTKFVSEFNGEVIMLKCKNDQIVEVYPSQRKIAEFKSKYYAHERSAVFDR